MRPVAAYTPIVGRRSSIPLVTGILAIVFSLVGIASSALFTFGPLSDLRHSESASTVTTWLATWLVVSGVLFLVHLLGGALSCGYRPAGRPMLVGYAIGALVLAAIDLVMVVTLDDGSRRFRTSVLRPHLIYSAIACVWPVIVLVLMKLRGARTTT